jgi:hypothetical protein
VSIAGFAFTIAQLIRTARASEATKVAVERTERRMALNHLLVLLPQFRLLESDLDSAAESGDRKLAIRALVAFAYIAGEVAGLLKGQDDVDQDVTNRLSNMARRAAQAKSQLIDNPAESPKAITKEVRSELADVSALLSGMVATFRLQAGKAT